MHLFSLLNDKRKMLDSSIKITKRTLKKNPNPKVIKHLNIFNVDLTRNHLYMPKLLWKQGTVFTLKYCPNLNSQILTPINIKIFISLQYT